MQTMDILSMTVAKLKDGVVQIRNYMYTEINSFSLDVAQMLWGTLSC